MIIEMFSSEHRIELFLPMELLLNLYYEINRFKVCREGEKLIIEKRHACLGTLGDVI